MATKISTGLNELVRPKGPLQGTRYNVLFRPTALSTLVCQSAPSAAGILATDLRYVRLQTPVPYIRCIALKQMNAALRRVGGQHPRNLRACSMGQAECGKSQSRQACEAQTNDETRPESTRETGLDRS